MIGGSAALGALVPLAAGAHCAARGLAAAGAGAAGGGAPRGRPPLPLCGSRPHHSSSGQPLAPAYRPYHKFIGELFYGECLHL